MENNIEICVGQIFEVITDDFYASKSGLNIPSVKNRIPKFHLPKGEKIEIRFPFAWNYRTEDSVYFHSEPDYILSKCKLIGKVKEDVRFKNCASLEEILRLDLFDSVKTKTTENA